MQHFLPAVRENPLFFSSLHTLTIAHCHVELFGPAGIFAALPALSSLTSLTWELTPAMLWAVGNDAQRTTPSIGPFCDADGPPIPAEDASLWYVSSFPDNVLARRGLERA
jgi:hypothetical protein